MDELILHFGLPDEAAALAGSGLAGDITLHQLRQTPTDGQTEARAWGIFGAGFQLREGEKELTNFLTGHADPGIGNHAGQLSLRLVTLVERERNLHLTLLGVFDPIIHEV